MARNLDIETALHTAMRQLLFLMSLFASAAMASPICDGIRAPQLLPGSPVDPPDAPELCEYFQTPAVLVVNTASACGFTPQYEVLQALHSRYRDKGLTILAFPSDNFGGQEYADAAKTAELCFRNYGVTFPVFRSSDVKGENANPLFQRLAKATKAPRWNFHKYLVTANGVVDFPSGVSPLDERLTRSIDAALRESAAD